MRVPGSEEDVVDVGDHDSVVAPFTQLSDFSSMLSEETTQMVD